MMMIIMWYLKMGYLENIILKIEIFYRIILKKKISVSGTIYINVNLSEENLGGNENIFLKMAKFSRWIQMKSAKTSFSLS